MNRHSMGKEKSVFSRSEVGQSMQAHPDGEQCGVTGELTPHVGAGVGTQMVRLHADVPGKAEGHGSHTGLTTLTQKTRCSSKLLASTCSAHAVRSFGE